VPVFLLGLLLQFVFAKSLKDTPIGLPPSGPLDAGIVPPAFYEQWGIGKNVVFEFVSNMDILNAVLIWRWDIVTNAMLHLILPAIALATIPMAVIARMTRSSLLDVLGLDYVRTARAKGLRERTVVVRHALRNSLLPVVTVIGLSLGSLIGGAILTETIFNLTGVGKTVYDAITARDYTVVQGFTLVIAIAFVIVNLITDIVYTYLDPKVRVT
jgi:peptide/nickel transport system permease protein